MAKMYWNAIRCSLTDNTPNSHMTPNTGISTAMFHIVALHDRNAIFVKFCLTLHDQPNCHWTWRNKQQDKPNQIHQKTSELILSYGVVSIYPQQVLSFCHNTCIWRIGMKNFDHLDCACHIHSFVTSVTFKLVPLLYNLLTTVGENVYYRVTLV